MKISESVKKVLIVTFTTIAVLFLIYFAGPPLLRVALYLFGLLSPFIFGYAFSRMINPFADKLQKRLKMPRVISVVILIILVLGILVGIIGGIGYNLVNEIKNLSEHWTELLEYLRFSWENLSSQWSGIYGLMPEPAQNAITRLGNNIYAQIMGVMSNIEVVNNAQDFAKSVPRGIVWTIIFVLSMFFMVTQRKSVDEFLHKLLGDRAIRKIIDIKNECKKFLWGYVKAQLILMSIIFFVILFILSMLNAQYAIIVALATAVLDALPFFGSGITLWPLSVICFITGDIKLGIAYIAIWLVIVLIRRFIEPKLVSDKLGLHPVVTLVTMYVGYRWWGIIGLITGPILFMLILSLYKAGLFDKIIKILKQLICFICREIKLFVNYLDNITKGE